MPSRPATHHAKLPEPRSRTRDRTASRPQARGYGAEDGLLKAGG